MSDIINKEDMETLTVETEYGNIEVGVVCVYQPKEIDKTCIAVIPTSQIGTESAEVLIFEYRRNDNEENSEEYTFETLSEQEFQIANETFQSIFEDGENELICREILFRGKRIDNDEWVEGGYWLNRTATEESYITDDDGNLYWLNRTATEESYIIDDDGDLHLVYPKTVGQYTGITDCNGKRVFEGDIVVWQKNNESYGVITYNNDETEFCVVCDKLKQHWNLGKCFTSLDIEVVGNIHDNSELIGDDENA